MRAKVGPSEGPEVTLTLTFEEFVTLYACAFHKLATGGAQVEGLSNWSVYNGLKDAVDVAETFLDVPPGTVDKAVRGTTPFLSGPDLAESVMQPAIREHSVPQILEARRS